MAAQFVLLVTVGLPRVLVESVVEPVAEICTGLSPRLLIHGVNIEFVRIDGSATSLWLALTLLSFLGVLAHLDFNFLPDECFVRIAVTTLLGTSTLMPARARPISCIGGNLTRFVFHIG